MASTTALHLTQLSHHTHDSHLPVAARWALAFAVTVTKWDQRTRSRRALARLTDAQLHDIGVSFTDARIETAKNFWRI